MRRRNVLGGIAGSLVAAMAPSAPRPDLAARAAAVGRLAASDYLSRADFMMYEVGEVRALHYAEVAAGHGCLLLASALSDRSILDGLHGRLRRMEAAKLPNSANHVDASIEGALLIPLGASLSDRAVLARGLALADGQFRETGPDGLTSQARWWIDDVWMIGRLQLAAAAATGEMKYRDRAARMARLYVARLQRPNGLFHHGPDARFFWGRGNGWVAVGLAEILAELPESHPDYQAVRQGYRRMMSALMRWQAPGGMWRQLIDHPGSWEESSATAMFGYALSLGARHGVLAGESWRRAAERAWHALQPRIGANGRLSGICVGTGQSRDAAYYLERPTVTGDLHGQAALLWLASEMVRR